MMVVKASGQICKRCGQFTKKFIVCEVCRLKVCMRCAGDSHFCSDHMIKVSKARIVADYEVKA